MMKIWSVNRGTIILIILCLALTGFNIWTHRNNPPPDWESIEQYGVKISHPRGYRFNPSVPSNWIIGYWEGGLQGEPNSDELEIIGVYWISDRANTLEDSLDFVFGVGRTENPGLTREPFESMNVAGFDVLYSRISLEIEGLRVPGILAAFRDPYGRTVLPYYLRYQCSEDYAEKMIKRLIMGMEFTAPVKQRELTEYWPTDGWKYATPEESDMDASVLQDMLREIESIQGGIQVDSVLVVKDGYIVLEKYYNDYTEDTPHIIYSCTKSIVSTIFGIAYEQDYIPNLDTRVLEIFPDNNPENLEEWKKQITLRDLLMMSAGYDARDSWIYDWENLNALHEASDAVEYTLDLPMAFEPGTSFEYTNAVSHLLSCIISEETGMSALDFGEEHLFEPLGITVEQWDTDNKGRNWGYNRIYITPKDMAKIGYLFLHKGEWDGEEIISQVWVEEATSHRIDANILDGYGYQWWVGEDFYAATGYMGQFIFVYPEQDLVIVFTGGTPETYDYSLRLPERYIIRTLN